MLFAKKIKSLLYSRLLLVTKSLASCGLPRRCLVRGQHSSKEISQRCRACANIMSGLTGPGVAAETSRDHRDVINHYVY